MCKVAIVGSRRFTNYGYMCQILDTARDNGKIDLIVSGGAKGADSLAQHYAKDNGIPILIYYPDWDKHNKAAGVIRNQHIVDEADIMIAFAYDDSIGTRDSIRKMEKAKKPVAVIELDQ